MSKGKAIVFIDGSNLYHNLKATFIRPGGIDLKALSDFVCSHFGYERKKTMYYNSLPNLADGEAVYYGHMEFLDKVKLLPNFEVKTRKLQHNSNAEILNTVTKEVSSLGLCGVCAPIVKAHWKDYIGSVNVKEKGVDVMIAVDMIKHGLIDSDCDACILISGDADFIPAMEMIKTGGKAVFSACTAKGYSFALRDAHGWFILDKKQLLDNCSKH